VACILLVGGLAGCSATGSSSSSSSSIVAVGQTLDIDLSEPPGFAADPAQLNLIHAEQLAFENLEGKSPEVKAYALQLKILHLGELSANARAAIQDKSAIAYLGELTPGDSELTAGILNALDLPMVSPADNAVELTRSTAAITNTPNKYYESYSVYGRTFARVVPDSAKEAAFDAKAIKSLGASVYVHDDGSDYGRAFAAALRSAAASAGLTVASSESSAATIFDASSSPAAAARFFDQAAAANPSAKLFAPSGLYAEAFATALSSAAKARTYISVPGFTKSQLNGAGRTFVKEFTTDYNTPPDARAIFGYAAMSALLHVLQREGASADNRAKVAKALRSITNLPSVLGTFSIDSDGDTNLDSFVVVRPGSSMFAIPSASALTPTG
jgi:ABC-type branched-subunit amino acid transport system substrate-binding protein